MEDIKSGKIPTILDNRDDNKVQYALERLLTCAKRLDVATGTFEIGSLLSLDAYWQQQERIRIVMGDETTRRTKRELISALSAATNDSIETEKEHDDNLTGLPAIRQALINKQIEVKVYSQAKFHAKTYIIDSKEDQPVDYAIVGSSNFTKPGLTQNLELNLFTTDQTHIGELKKWYEQVWGEAEDVNDELVNVINPHLHSYDPFTVYAKTLKEYFHGKEKLQDDWERNDSVIYSILSQYQKDGYHRALQIADEWNGALICDGVGLGKTFIGLMILERCIRDGKRVLMVVPKSAEQSVWWSNINRYLSPVYRRFFKELFDIKRHTDFGREGTITDDDLQYYREYKDVIIIDEAHHFRNPNANRGNLLMDLAGNKKLFMLTATPINNKLDDLYHLINYFAQDKPTHFARLGIQNLRKYFIQADKRMETEHSDLDVSEAAVVDDFLRTDVLLKNVLIQRSRKYVKDSETTGGASAVFPERQLPRVINYSLKSVYASLYGEIKDAFNHDDPFLTLAIYNTSRYATHPDPTVSQTQVQVVSLIRTLLLKRLESSFKAFEASVEDLLAKMAKFMKVFAPDQYDTWINSNTRWWSIVQDHIRTRLEIDEQEPEEDDEVPDAYMTFNPEDHEMERLLRDLQGDMEQLTIFLSKIYRRFYDKDNEGLIEDPVKDNKLQELLKHLKEDSILKGNKVIIFTEFRDTARYLFRQLKGAGLKHIEQIDSGRQIDREKVIKHFAPYYNCDDQTQDLFGDTELKGCLKNPINILISTDVLSEGLNLQDASLLINYDLHWNPVRLMQRIGRVDRRLNPAIEAKLKRPAKLNGKVYFWNFLPPDELEDILHLKQRLDGKITRINKTLGIEGALLTPDDPQMSLKEFNERYEGKETIEELMSLERQRLSEENQDLWNMLDAMPRRLFSGKITDAGWSTIVNRDGEQLSEMAPNDKPGIVFAFRMPSLDENVAGEVKYYFYDLQTGDISEDLGQCWKSIRCIPGTEREVSIGISGLSDVRKAVEKHIKNSYLKSIQAPVGMKPALIAWMEISRSNE